MFTQVRILTGVILTVVLLVLGFVMINEEGGRQIGSVLLAFAVLRGALVARQAWGEWSNRSLGE